MIWIVILSLFSIELAAIEPIVPIPLTIELDENKVKLGELIFHDKGISKNDSITCVTCHILEYGGVNRKQYSSLYDGTLFSVNPPTIFNVGFQSMLLFDGHVTNLEEFSKSPGIVDLFGLTQEEVVTKFKKNEDYVKRFKEIYNDEITFDHIANALAVYQKSLITPNSRFDQWLRGNKSAITEEELQGYQLFKGLGCIVCHNGINVGSNSFQKMGNAVDYFSKRENVTDNDLGRYNITKNDFDKYRYKVPSLRNIAVTYPYLRDGSVQNLDEVVRTMGKYQLGEELTDEQVRLIVKFLHTLTGQYKDKPFEP